MIDHLTINLTAIEPPDRGHNVTLAYGGATEYSKFSLSTVAHALEQLHIELNQSSPDLDVLKKAGAALFDELLGGELFRTYNRVTGQIALQDRQLYLHIRSDQPDLIAIPWEYLYDPDQDQWLALRSDISLIRGLPLGHHGDRHEPQSITGPLRVLVMASEPSDLKAINSEQEVTNLEAIEASGVIEVISVEPTYAALQSALRQQMPHVFHFIGHGTFSEIHNQGVLAFCQPDKLGEAHLVEAERLATLLRGCNTLGLVLLNTCDGAVTGGKSAFAGLTQRLIQQAIPAVIAMQAPIFDEYAIDFSEVFYKTLAEGYSMATAVDEGRKRINGMASCWGVPAFYLQSSQPFTIEPLSLSERANFIWQKSQKIQKPSQRRFLLEGALKLVSDHVGVQADLARLKNEEQAAQLYNVALSHLHKEQWQETDRILSQLEQLLPNYRDTRMLLSQIRGKLSRPSQSPADPEQYRPILNALSEGRLTPFLGGEVSCIGRSPEDAWVQGLYPPGALDTAVALAQYLPPELQTEDSLLQVSQYTILHDGPYALYERLHALYEGQHTPTMLHRLLAELPQRLGDDTGYPKGGTRRYVLFSTALDDLLERAFQEVNQPYHLFAYRPGFVDDQGVKQVERFFHYLPENIASRESIPVLKPNEYNGHDQDNHPVIIKLCGLLDPDEPDCVAVTEDHYMNYVSTEKSMAVLPTTLLNQVKRNNFLFFGHSLQPWHLRLIWQRLKLSHMSRQSLKWAIAPNLGYIEKKFWQSQNINIIEATPEEVVAHIKIKLDEGMIR